MEHVKHRIFLRAVITLRKVDRILHTCIHQVTFDGEVLLVDFVGSSFKRTVLLGLEIYLLVVGDSCELPLFGLNGELDVVFVVPFADRDGTSVDIKLRISE